MFRRLKGHLRFRIIVIAVGSVCLGFCIGFVVAQSRSRQPTAATASNLRINGNRFTSPLLLGDVSNDQSSPQLESLNKEIQGIIARAQDNGSITVASVFYRELGDGNQINVNGDEKYYPASLTKVPLMMAYYKASESDPSLLDIRGKLEFQQDYNANQEIKPAKYPISGQEYTINELIEMMIKYSDNIGFQLMIDGAETKDTLKEMYTDFQLTYFYDQGQVNIVTPRDYSRFLRALYNATYLNIDNSEKALQLMSESDFKDGIVAGVPNSVVVSHKYGLSTNRDSAGAVTQRQLHDCGVVYRTKQPYVLCVMTKSTAELPKIESVIKDLSAAVYANTEKK